MIAYIYNLFLGNFFLINARANRPRYKFLIDIKINTNGRTGTQADFNSNETVKFSFTGSEHISINQNNGKLSVGTDISGSDFTFDNNSFISGSVTASNAFGTMTSSLVQVKIAINNAPVPSFSNSTANGFLNSNEESSIKAFILLVEKLEVLKKSIITIPKCLYESYSIFSRSILLSSGSIFLIFILATLILFGYSL